MLLRFLSPIKSIRVALFFFASCFTAALHAQDAWFAVPQEITTQNLWSIAYGGRTLVAVGEQGTILSNDYVDRVWLPRVSGVGVWLVGVGFGNGRFVVVGDRGTILTSDDAGVTWTARTSGTTTRLNSAAYGNSRWLVVGEQGAVLTSTDGTTWTQRPALGAGFLRALAFGQGQFLLGGANGVLYSTTDATTFTPVASGTTANIEAAAITANRFWITGSNGLWASATQPGSWSFGPAITTTTFRGVAARSADEVVAVSEVGAAVFRNGTWTTVSPAPSFLATAVTQGENEMIAVGFGGGIARADIATQPVVTQNGPVEYGKDVKIAVASFGNVPLSYQWYTGAGVLIPGATQTELNVSRITPTNNDYQLRFTDANGGSGSLGVTVVVYPAGQPEVRDPNFIPGTPKLPVLVVPQPDGKILVTGSFSVTPGGGATYGLARLNANGSLDQGFRAGAGIPTTTGISALHVLADGRIYARGSFTSIGDQSRAGLARLFANGAIDQSFAPTDSALSFPINSAVSTDGRLYVQNGSFYSGTVYRVATDGSIDTTFPPIPGARLIGLDAEGRLLVVTHNPGPDLVRYLSDGTLDAGYTTTRVSEGASETLARTVITPAGLYAASSLSTRFSTNWSFVRFLPNGGRDTSYQSPSGNNFGALGYTGSFNFIWRADGSLWQIVSRVTGFGGVLYGPDGRVDSTSYATLPNLADFQILAIAPDNSLLAITNRYLSPNNSAFVRIRPLSGRAGRLTNLSIRAAVAGDPLIAGFVTNGSDATSAIVRAIGPGLTPFNVPDALRDPQLRLVRDSTTIATNDNWDAALAPRFASVGAFALPSGSKDAALEWSVGAGNYTAVVTPAPGESGTALAEIYQSTDAFTASRRFINMSARSTVDPAHPLIVGFTIAGDVPVSVLVRGAGPRLAASPFNLPGTLADPLLTLYRGTTALWENNDWTSRGNGNTPIAPIATQAGAFAFTDGSKDSAIIVTLAPGSYTAVVNGANNTSGLALVEVYEVP